MDSFNHTAAQEVEPYSTTRIETDFKHLVTPCERRSGGVTFTPQDVVDLMLGVLGEYYRDEATIVDPGAGAGRFSLAAASGFPRGRVFAVEINTSLADALADEVRARDLATRIDVVNADFLRWSFPSRHKPVLFLGNPPYVRHHAIAREQKEWLRQLAQKHDRKYSALSGLHVYFLLRCLLEGKVGDRILLILPTEWLETAYGTAVKQTLLERCTRITLHLFSPDAAVFGSTMTTSLILDATVGPATRVVHVAQVHRNSGALSREPLPMAPAAHENWLRAAHRAFACEMPAVDSDQEIRLGDLFNVHRGQVTGMNSLWIADEESSALVPGRFLFPAVTDAKEIFNAAGGALTDSRKLRRVIDLPADLSDLTADEKERVRCFLSCALARGGQNSYIAMHRNPWWRVGLKAPPPLVMSYMARRAPRFIVNECNARLLNVAHGLYPKISLTRGQLLSIADMLNASRDTRCGRTYAGGLLKIEPGEARRIPLCKEKLADLMRTGIRAHGGASTSRAAR